MLADRPEPPSSDEPEEDSLSYADDDEDDEDYKVEEEEKAKMEKVLAKKRLKLRGKRRRGQKKKALEEESEDCAAEDPTVGDVFALEMELSRENDKMMRVRRRRGGGCQPVSQLLIYDSLTSCVCVSRNGVIEASSPEL